MHKNHLNSAQSDLVGQQTNIKEQNQIYVQSPRFLPLRVYLSETNSIWDGKVSHYARTMHTNYRRHTIHSNHGFVEKSKTEMLLQWQ